MSGAFKRHKDGSTSPVIPKLRWSDRKAGDSGLKPKEQRRSLYIGEVTFIVTREGKWAGRHKGCPLLSYWIVEVYATRRKGNGAVILSTIPGLTNNQFGTRKKAQRAVEKWLKPVLPLVVAMVTVNTNSTALLECR